MHELYTTKGANHLRRKWILVTRIVNV